MRRRLALSDRHPPESESPDAHALGHREDEADALRILGLAMRAGRARAGSDAVLALLRSGEAKLVLLSEDAGQNGAKKFADKCAFYHIPLVKISSRHRLGRACGRAETVVVAVTDPGFAAKISKQVGEFNGGEAFDETARV